MDNGTQFNNAKIKSFGEMYKIKINFSPAYHLQANEMVETTNKLIVGNLRRNLEELVGGTPKSVMGATYNKEKSNR